MNVSDQLQLALLNTDDELFGARYRRVEKIKVYINDLGRNTGRWYKLKDSSPLLEGDLFVRTEDLDMRYRKASWSLSFSINDIITYGGILTGAINRNCLSKLPKIKSQK